MKTKPIESERDQIITDASKYMGAVYLSQALALATSIVIRRVLGPYLMGVWTAMTVVFTYGWYAQAGVMQAAERELPYNYGKGDYAHAEVVKDTALVVSTVGGVLICLAMWGVALSLRGNVSEVVFWGIMVQGIVGFANQLAQFYIVLLRARKNFGLISKSRALFGLLATVGNSAAVIFLGIYGLYLLLPLFIFGEFVYLYWNTRYALSTVNLSLKELKRLLVIGIPMLIGSMGSDTMQNVDKIVIVAALGAESLGFYTIALMVHNYAYRVPNLFSAVMYPRFQETYGAKGTVDSISGFVMTPTLVMAYLMPILLGGAYIGVPFLVRVILPQYVSGLEPLKILILGTFFQSLYHMSGQFLWTVNKQVQVMPIGWVAAGLGFLLSRLALNLGWGMEGVAFAVSISYALHSGFIVAYAMSHFATAAQIARFLTTITLPLGYTAIVLKVMDIIVPENTASIVADIYWTGLRVGLFMVSMVPLIWYVNKRTGVLTSIADLVIPKLRAAIKLGA